MARACASLSFYHNKNYFSFTKNIELNGFGDVFNNPKNIVPHHTVSSIINLQPASINLLDV